MKTLAETLPEEIQRCKELMEQYKEIGPAGTFGFIMIRTAVERAIEADLSGNAISMAASYRELKECK